MRPQINILLNWLNAAKGIRISVFLHPFVCWTCVIAGENRKYLLPQSKVSGCAKECGIIQNCIRAFIYVYTIHTLRECCCIKYSVSVVLCAFSATENRFVLAPIAATVLVPAIIVSDCIAKQWIWTANDTIELHRWMCITLARFVECSKLSLRSF